MAGYYVHCIVKKPSHDDPYTSIQEYGVSTSPMGTATERWTQAEMIAILEAKTHVVKSLGLSPATGTFEYADLEVITRKDGSKYVKTKNDGDEPDNLLKQDECDAKTA